MTTKRKRTQATSREGINFVRSLVERHNSTFQEIDGQNDLGNDAYLEFTVEENATGCCVALQIKSGPSYRTATEGYAFSSNKDHFEYWMSHTLPVIAVIYDPERCRAVWSDITEHLRSAPAVVAEGPFSITCPESQELSDTTFEQFRDYCLRYREQYSREPNFGRALASFADRENVERCFDGLRALFAYHRQQASTWYYFVSCLANYRGHPVLAALIVRLCHVPGHGDIFWHKGNMISETARQFALAFMGERFGAPEVLTMLTAIGDDGIQRGSLGQCVHALVDVVPGVESILESIAVDRTQSERVIHSAIVLAASAAQWKSPAAALALLDRIEPTLQDEDLVGTVGWLRDDLTNYGAVFLY